MLHDAAEPRHPADSDDRPHAEAPSSVYSLMTGLLGLVCVSLLCAACGPVRSTQAISKAEVEFERARVVGAHQKAPYEYYSAKQYLHKAKEEWGYSEFEAALDFAEQAEQAAESARRKAKEDPWEDPVDRNGDDQKDDSNTSESDDTDDQSDDSSDNEGSDNNGADDSASQDSTDQTEPVSSRTTPANYTTSS